MMLHGHEILGRHLVEDTVPAEASDARLPLAAERHVRLSVDRDVAHVGRACLDAQG
jgi:hypothetical protein